MADTKAGGAATEWRPSESSAPRLHALARDLTRLRTLDRVGVPLGRTVRRLVGPGGVRDALSGRVLGHAAHPLMTDLPIGTWTSATLLDALGTPPTDRASKRLLAVGIAAALPTAATGLLDWSDTEPADDEVRRVGIVHALANVTSLSLYGASLIARRRGHGGVGRLLGFAGAGALAVGGHLGGHLSYAKAVGVDATALGPTVDDWTDAGPAIGREDRAPTCREVDGVAVLLVRHDGRVHALADRCSHRGGALHEGDVADGCVTCPLHGSRFRLVDGSVERGPSPYPQPTYDVREVAGRLEIRSAHEQPTL